MKRIPGSLPLYVEKGAPKMDSVFLSNKAYGTATQCLVLLCADVLIVNKRTKKFYLAERKSRPAKDWLWFIGGRRKFGELPLKSAQRCFERETGLRIAERRFIYVDNNEYFFVDREQEPRDIGTHSVALTFFVDLTLEEVELIKLDPNEYHAGGLHELEFGDFHSYQLPGPVTDIVHRVFKPKRKARS